MTGDHRDAGEFSGISSDGNIISYYTFFQFFSPVRRIKTSKVGQFADDFSGYDYPDVNANGDIVFSYRPIFGPEIVYRATETTPQSQIFVANGSQPRIADRVNGADPEVVYISNGNVWSSKFGRMDNGTWADINNGGNIIYEKITNGYSQIFRAAPNILDLIDPNPSLLASDGQIIAPTSPSDVDKLATQGVAQMKGAAADGVTKLLLRVHSAVPVTFSLPSGSPSDGSLDTLPSSGGTQNTSVIVSPVQDSSGNSWAFAVYTAPHMNTLAPTLPPTRQITLQASFGSTVLTATEVLEPPPVVLVHGIWSSGQEAWVDSGFKQFLESRGLNVFLADYGAFNYVDFDPALPRNLIPPVNLLIYWISFAKAGTRSRGIAVTQVDIVAHSMGGLVSRGRVALPDYRRLDNLMTGDFHKLITFGTPHFGTELADWLWSHKDDHLIAGLVALPPLSLASVLTVGDFFGIIGKKIDGAVFGLRINSISIVDLGATRVPTHAIACFEPSSSNLEKFLDSIPMLSGNLGTTVDGLLGGEMMHDCLVNGSSQFGGLTGPAISEIAGVVHAGFRSDVGETSSPAVQEEVFIELFIDPTTTDFATQIPPSFSGPVFPLLSLPSASLPSSRKASTQFAAPASAQGAVVSLTPVPGTTFKPGDQVQIIFQITDGNSVDGCFVIVGKEIYQFSGAGPYSALFNVPTNFVGSMDVIAITFGPGPENYAASTSFIVQPAARLISLNVSPSTIGFSFASESVPLVVMGNYSDGIQRNISQAATGTRYATLSGGNSVVSAGADGLIVATGNGQDSVLVANGGITTSVPVNVKISNDAPILTNPGGQSLHAGTPIEVSLTATDPNGDAIRLSLLSAPPFVSLTDNGNGSGTLHLALGAQDVGVFSVIVAVGDNGSPPLGATQTIEITVSQPTDTTPPTIMCPSDITVSTDPGKCSAIVNFKVTATDNLPGVIVVCDPPSASEFPIGTTVVSCIATDAAGLKAKCRFTITVKDREPPAIAKLMAIPNTLWPPNHKIVPVNLIVSATDNCGPTTSKIISVTSNEPGNGPGDDNPSGDWEITGDLTLNLRAERSGKGNGRIYTITVESQDTSGNSSTKSVLVTVPHDQNRK